MILILSESDDLSTTNIIEWLEILGKSWVRINSDDDINFTYIGDDVLFELFDVQFKLSDIKSFWYRRGFFNHSIKNNTDINEYYDFQKQEINTLLQFLYYKLTKIHHLDSVNNSSVNKLIATSIANDFDIDTPKSYIFSNRQSLVDSLQNLDSSFITKTICGNPTLHFDGFLTKNLTKQVDFNKINTETFFPSLLQNYIDKKFELRIFYFKNIFYTMAIFSQNDNKTSIDFRNYNDEKPNRRVPYQLPIYVEEKLNLLMKKLNFDTGSIDMIVTMKNEYIFLEVNPVGQFGMTSFPCNYNVEKKIAEYLCDYE